MQSDMSEYSLLFSKYLFKDKIVVNGNFSESEDNIYHLRNMLTRRINGGFIVGYNPGKKWKMDLNVFLSDLSQHFIHIQMGDSLKLNQLNKMVSSTVYYLLNDRQNTSNTI